MPAVQSAVLGEPQALLRIWVDVGPEASGWPVDDPTHQETIPSSFVPELVAFIENIRDQKNEKVPKSSSKPSLDQLTPSQEMVAGIPPENLAASNLPKAKKRAFRRTPLLATSTVPKSQPVEASLDTHTADGISSLEAGPPETPRGSKWGMGNFFEPIGSIKKLLGFNPLAPVFQSPELVSQTPTSITAQTQTEEPAPRERKNKRSSPTSAKDARAKNRRHNDLVIKPMKPATASKNQRDRLSRAREVSPASGGTKTTGVQEEQVPDIRSTDRVQGEARQVEVEEPASKQIIRWPSRSLDRMNQNKRKRWGEPVAEPSSDGGSYGNKEEKGMTEEQPRKILRTRESQEFTSQVAGDPNTARPHKYQGTNVFAEYEAAQKAAKRDKQSPAKTPIPITNSTGTFKVPSPSDSDWSDSGSEEEEGNTAGLEDMTPSRDDNALASQVANPQRIPPLIQSEALRKAREKLLKYKPRNPSRLIHSSRASPSPSTAVDLKLTGNTSFTAFEDWCKTAPLAVTKALETMEVDHTEAGNAFARGLEDTRAGSTNRYTAFEEWSKTASSAVTAVLENMEVDSDFAGQAFKSGLDNYAKS